MSEYYVIVWLCWQENLTSEW